MRRGGVEQHSLQTCLYRLTHRYGLAIHTDGSEGNAGPESHYPVGWGLLARKTSQLTKGNAVKNSDLSHKPCPNGHTAGEVIGFRERHTDKELVPYRVCWYCPECQWIDKSIGREKYVEKSIDS